MKTVLIVDDDKLLLENFQEGLSDHAGVFTLVTAENGAKASVMLSSTPVDLVITDLKMPVMDGFELLAYMSKHHPRIPTIVMTAYRNNPELERKLRLFAVSQFLQKPFDLEELATVITNELKFASTGHLRGVTLPSFLQLIAIEERTCTLSIEFGEEAGTLYFKQGELLDAETGSLSGNDAVYHMASWDHAKIEISPNCTKKEKRVRGSINELLLEGFRRKDEQAARAPGRAEAPPAAAPAIAVDPGGRGAAVQEIREEKRGGQEQAPGATLKEGTMATTKEILSELAKIPNIDAICLVARDGFLLDSIARTGIDKEMIGAIASSGFGASESMGRQIDKGTMLISMIEFEKGPVLLAPIGEDAFLVIVADKEANLGMIRLKLKKHSGELALAAAI
jgi:predicted regulator of Ras-like GTPase activity (Roadblock/LC7/MglB family)/CheY-like chemotaxis protein